MNNLFRSFLVFVLLNIGFHLNAQDWKTVKIEEQEYKISFPGNTEDSTTDVPTEKGSVAMHSQMLQSTLEDKNILYMSSYTNYPESFFPNGLDTIEAQNTVLENAINGAVTNVNGTLISKESITFNGFPGRVIKIEIDKGDIYILTMKSILVGFKFYLLQTISLKGSDENENAAKFFNSFELIKVKH